MQGFFARFAIAGSKTVSPLIEIAVAATALIVSLLGTFRGILSGHHLKKPKANSPGSLREQTHPRLDLQSISRNATGIPSALFFGVSCFVVLGAFGFGLQDSSFRVPGWGPY